MDCYHKNKTDRASGLGGKKKTRKKERERQEIGKRNQTTALRFQTGQGKSDNPGLCSRANSS